MQDSSQTRTKLFFPIIVLMAVCIIASPHIAVADHPGPKESIQSLNASLLDAMQRADALGYGGRYKLLEPVIRNTFAFSFMGTKSVGRFWEKLSEEQRSIFSKTYEEWSIATYAGRFDGYSGEKFEVISESTPVQGTVTVISKLIQANEEPITFYYLMRMIDGRWRVVDIQISGVSQLALTRAQFSDVLKSKGFTALITMLKEKTAAFAKPKKQ